jgi:hypothetical protein
MQFCRASKTASIYLINLEMRLRQKKKSLWPNIGKTYIQLIDLQTKWSTKNFLNIYLKKKDIYQKMQNFNLYLSILFKTKMERWQIYDQTVRCPLWTILPIPQCSAFASQFRPELLPCDFGILWALNITEKSGIAESVPLNSRNFVSYQHYWLNSKSEISSAQESIHSNSGMAIR